MWHFFRNQNFRRSRSVPEEVELTVNVWTGASDAPARSRGTRHERFVRPSPVDRPGRTKRRPCERNGLEGHALRSSLVFGIGKRMAWSCSSPFENVAFRSSAYVRGKGGLPRRAKSRRVDGKLYGRQNGGMFRGPEETVQQNRRTVSGHSSYKCKICASRGNGKVTQVIPSAGIERFSPGDRMLFRI